MIKKVSDVLVRKHSTIATAVFTASVGASFAYSFTTGRSALMDAKAWLGATTMTEESVLETERQHRKYQMRLSR